MTKKKQLYSKRSTENVARGTAIYLVRRLCCITLPNVGTELGINNYSTVSSVVQRFKRRIEKDRTLLKELKIIEGRVKSGLDLPYSAAIEDCCPFSDVNQSLKNRGRILLSAEKY